MSFKNLAPYVGSLGAAVFLATLFFADVYMSLAALAYFLLLTGYTLARVSRRAHMWLMISGVILDLSLVLLLEFQRDAIATSLASKLNPLQQAHVIFSLGAVLGYFPVIALGVLLSRPSFKGRSLNLSYWHRRVGRATLILRTLGFLLMYSMLSLKTNS